MTMPLWSYLVAMVKICSKLALSKHKLMILVGLTHSFSRKKRGYLEKKIQLQVWDLSSAWLFSLQITCIFQLSLLLGNQYLNTVFFLHLQLSHFLFIIFNDAYVCILLFINMGYDDIFINNTRCETSPISFENTCGKRLHVLWHNNYLYLCILIERTLSRCISLDLLSLLSKTTLYLCV